jgi:hypothetical protein
MLNFKNLLARTLFAFALAASAGAAVAGPTYHVDVNTSALAGTSGYLDFLIIPQGDAATTVATLTHFIGNFSGTVYTGGDGSGSAAAGGTIGNSGDTNELGLWANFGGNFSFDVSFTQAANGIAGSLFEISLLDGGFNYLPPTSGDIATFDLEPGHAAVLTSSAFATISTVSAVPEPSELLLMTTGLGLVGFMLRRRKATAAH